jgi:hypothetical protein
MTSEEKYVSVLFFWNFQRHLTVLTISCCVQNLANNMDLRLALSPLSDHIWVKECSACGWIEVHWMPNTSWNRSSPRFSTCAFAIHAFYKRHCQPNIIFSYHMYADDLQLFISCRPVLTFLIVQLVWTNTSVVSTCGQLSTNYPSTHQNQKRYTKSKC